MPVDRGRFGSGRRTAAWSRRSVTAVGSPTDSSAGSRPARTARAGGDCCWSTTSVIWCRSTAPGWPPPSGCTCASEPASAAHPTTGPSPPGDGATGERLSVLEQMQGQRGHRTVRGVRYHVGRPVGGAPPARVGQPEDRQRRVRRCHGGGRQGGGRGGGAAAARGEQGVRHGGADSGGVPEKRTETRAAIGRLLLVAQAHARLVGEPVDALLGGV